MIKNKSFTLIELLVVIVIIGILAGVIIVSTSSSINKANFAKAQAFSNTVQQELLLNLVSEWTFDEDSGNTAKDTWGNNDGTLYGANGLPQLQTKEDCVYGTCYLFDGVDDYIDFGNNNLSMGIKDQAVSMWVKFDSISVSGHQTLIANGAYNEGLGYDGIFLYKVSTSSRINLSFSDGSLNRVTLGVGDVKDTNWHYLLLSIDRDQGATLYVDGIFSGLILNITGQQGDVQNIISTRTYLSPYLFKGFLDEIRVYNAILSISQIKQNYIAGLNSLLASGSISKEEYDQRLNNLAQK